MSDDKLMKRLQVAALQEAVRLNTGLTDNDPKTQMEHTLYWIALVRIKELSKVARDLANPVDDTSRLCPLVLYLASEEDRQEVIDAFKEAKPNAEAIPI